MKQVVYAALLLTSCVAAAWAQPVTPQIVEGVALRLPERDEVYRERHEIAPLEHRIEYRSPDGALIAINSLDYRCSDSAPAFEQHDLRSDTRIGARWENGAYLLLHGDESRPLARTDALVASSGFDRFVLANWNSLLAGDIVEFDFALPARLQTLRLRIARFAASEDLPGAALWLSIVPAQPLLRPFVDPIVLAYDDGRRLALYRGLSNLADADGKAISVEIRYRHLYAGNAGAEREIVANALPATDPVAGASRKPAHTHCSGERT